jgi:hypothetical protein
MKTGAGQTISKRNPLNPIKVADGNMTTRCGAGTTISTKKINFRKKMR